MKKERWTRKKRRKNGEDKGRRERERDREREEGRKSKEWRPRGRQNIHSGRWTRCGNSRDLEPARVGNKIRLPVCKCCDIFCRFVFSLISLSSSLHNTSRARVWRKCGFFVFVSVTRISFCLRYHLKECLVFSWFLWTYYRRFLFLLSSGRKCWSYLSRFSWFCFAQDCRELLLGFFY